jgi:hypothetical protein
MFRFEEQWTVNSGQWTVKSDQDQGSEKDSLVEGCAIPPLAQKTKARQGWGTQIRVEDGAPG